MASEASDERRLHPLSWLFAAGQAAKSFVVPLLLVVFASRSSTYELWAAVFIIPITLSAVVQYVVFRYRLDHDELVVRDGILTRSERHIPYARIQNIDLVQNPLHRLMRVALVRVETASGTKPEAVIRVLSLDAIEEMRTRVFAGRAADAAPEGGSAEAGAGEAGAGVDRREILSVPASELTRLGIVSNKGLVVVSAILGLLWQRSWWDRDQESLVEEYLGEMPDRLLGLTSSAPLPWPVVIVLVLITGVVVLRVISVSWFLVQLYGFTLRRHGQDLRAEYGLVTRVSRTIPRGRIQTLIVTESLLHRWFRRQSVELRTVGGGGDDLDLGLEGAQPTARSQWLAPIVEGARVPALISSVLPEIDLTALHWEPIAARSWLRLLRRGLLLVAVLSVPAVLRFDAWALLGIVPAVGWVTIHARLTVRHTGYALSPWGLAFKTGWWERTVKLVRYAKIQTVALAQTPLDRRAGMASVRIDTAGAGGMGHTIDIPFLDLDIATEVSERLYKEAGRRAFRW